MQSTKKIQYKVQSNQSVNQEDITLDMTSERLSPRSHKSQAYTKYKYREELYVLKGH